jgi:RNA recognition motif-containing protein
MADSEAEDRAIEALQGAELMGRPLRINKAEPRGSAPRPAGAAAAAMAVAAPVVVAVMAAAGTAVVEPWGS